MHVVVFSSRYRGDRQRPKTKDIRNTHRVLKLSNESTYTISVTAVRNGSLESPESQDLQFTAFRNSTSAVLEDVSGSVC